MYGSLRVKSWNEQEGSDTDELVFDEWKQRLCLVLESEKENLTPSAVAFVLA